MAVTGSVSLNHLQSFLCWAGDLCYDSVSIYSSCVAALNNLSFAGLPFVGPQSFATAFLVVPEHGGAQQGELLSVEVTSGCLWLWVVGFLIVSVTLGRALAPIVGKS